MSGNRKRNMKKEWKGIVKALPFVLPGLILVAIFVLYPMLFTIRISFSDYQIVKREITWTGIENYLNVFNENQGRFWYAYRNNFLYALVTTPFIIFFGMLFAYLINNLNHGKTLFKVGFYLPVITSWVIVGLVFQYMFNSSDRGLINYLMVNVLHLTDEYIPWLIREWPGNIAIWLMGIWKNIGWAMIIYMAALQGISNDLYEAASLDGASTWKKFIGLVIPLVRPTTYFILVNMIIGSFNVFIQVLLLTHGDPSGKTASLQYLIYDRAFSQFKFGEASAVGMITAVTILILTLLLNRGLKLDKVEKEEL
jgi:multiple sugar transport system permease protein